MRGRANLMEQVVQQRIDLEKYLSPLVRCVDGVLHENRFHAHKLDTVKTATHLEDCVPFINGQRLIDIAYGTSETGATNVMLNRLIVHIGRGGLSVKDWRGV